MNSTSSYQRMVSLGYVMAAIVLYVVTTKVGEILWDLLRWSYPESLPLTPPELIALAVAAGGFAILRLTPTINDFMNEAAVELSKVTWPTRKESTASATVITVVVALCAVVLVVYDVVWTWGIKLFY